MSPGWPDDPDTVEEAIADPEAFADKTIGQVADHYSSVIGQLSRKPAIIGHSFGGLLAEIVAGRGFAAVSVAIDAAPFRGIPQLSLSSLRATSPVPGNPANRHRAVPLTYEQFRYSFANAVDEDQARRLFDTFAVQAPGDTRNPDRGPMLVVSGEKDHTVPPALSRAAYARQQRNPGVTEFAEIPGRGHALTIDGWQEVADTALTFIRRFA